jgi:predicted  nucleic acid-binding Zn-ribbon protein
MEEAILGMMDEAEAVEAEVERARVDLRNHEDGMREAEKVLQGQAKEVEDRLRAKSGMRDLLAREVDPDVLAVYDRVRVSRRGVGLATVTVDAEGAHFCSACQMTVTLQEVSVALSGQKLVQCRSCNRVLFVGTIPAGSGGAEAEEA